MAIFYRCVLNRIVRLHEDTESSVDEEDRIERNKRNSRLIVVEMQDFSRR